MSKKQKKKRKKNEKEKKNRRYSIINISLTVISIVVLITLLFCGFYVDVNLESRGLQNQKEGYRKRWSELLSKKSENDSIYFNNRKRKIVLNSKIKALKAKASELYSQSLSQNIEKDSLQRIIAQFNNVVDSLKREYIRYVVHESPLLSIECSKYIETLIDQINRLKPDTTNPPNPIPLKIRVFHSWCTKEDGSKTSMPSLPKRLFIVCSFSRRIKHGEKVYVLLSDPKGHPLVKNNSKRLTRISNIKQGQDTISFEVPTLKVLGKYFFDIVNNSGESLLEKNTTKNYFKLKESNEK